jgi:hypothetical protein
VFWVHSAGETLGEGTFTRPFATIAQAQARCVAGRGDIIICKPGHTETITAAAGIALGIVFLMKRPARFGMVVFAAACVVALLLNIGTLAIEFNANKRVLRWLEDRLDHAPGAIDKLQQILSSVATREVGDLLNSPRYFFLSALPGTSRTRPLKSEDKKEESDRDVK